MPIRLRSFFTGLLLLSLATGALAQAEVRASRERELLRRAQAALQEANTERDALRAEKATLSAERDALKQQAERSATEAAALKRAGTAQKAEAERLQASLASSSIDAAAKAQAAAAREAELRTQVMALQRELAERVQANRQLATLLANSTSALGASEERNRNLHALGHELIERWLHRSPADINLQREPFFGFERVALEDRAETLRARLDALQIPPPPRP